MGVVLYKNPGVQVVYEDAYPRARTFGNIAFLDALSDEDVERYFLYPFAVRGKDTPGIKKDKIDQVENITLQILAHLSSIADRQDRSEIEAAISPVKIEAPLSPPLYNPPLDRDLDLLDQKANLPIFYQFQDPFRKETNFNEQEDPEVIINTTNVAYNILSTLGDIFLGYDFFNSGKNTKTDAEMEVQLRDDRTYWFKVLNKNYESHFRIKVADALDRAGFLLKDRQDFAKEAYYHRLTLYATLILSLLGKLLNQKALTIFGLATSSITLIFMLTHYKTKTITLKGDSNKLKNLVATAESLAYRNRKLDPYLLDQIQKFP